MLVNMFLRSEGFGCKLVPFELGSIHIFFCYLALSDKKFIKKILHGLYHIFSGHYVCRAVALAKKLYFFLELGFEKELNCKSSITVFRCLSPFKIRTHISLEQSV